MKILLVNPPAQNVVHWYRKEKEHGLTVADFGKFPPLGLLYIAAYIEKHAPQHSVYLLDCAAEEISYNSLADKILKIQPDIIGITSYSVDLVDVVKTLQTARAVMPKAHLVLGGHHVMAFPFEAINIATVDSIIVGEGEVAFLELVKALEADSTLNKISGVYTKESVKKLPPATCKEGCFASPVKFDSTYVDNLDELPFPARKYTSHIPYYSILGVSKKLTSIITSRGCPYKCSYCDVPYKQYRARSIKNVVDEIEQCITEGYEEFHVYDDTFNINAQRVIEFSQELIKRNLRITWDFRGRVNSITEECLTEAKKAGLRFISFGVEYGTDEGLSVLNKGTTVEQIKKTFALCNKLKIKTTANFILGTPTDKTESDIKHTVDFAIELNPTNAQFSVLMLHPNTPIYENAFKKGLVDPQRWKDFCANPTTEFYVDHWGEFFTIDQLTKYHKYAYRRFYLRFSRVMSYLAGLSSIDEFFIKLKAFWRLLVKNK
ncbi:MAG: B12-binding domain-containing radical SAM protein [Elusimicrobia bacterium]|nr:B12-binding domain-containing radical SAM protein [Elusimicrobiota bacterium]